MEQQQFSFAKFSFVDQLSIRMDFGRGKGKRNLDTMRRVVSGRGKRLISDLQYFPLPGEKRERSMSISLQWIHTNLMKTRAAEDSH